MFFPFKLLANIALNAAALYLINNYLHLLDFPNMASFIFTVFIIALINTIL